ncbi:hypothetical protein B0H14DRAFT_3671873 [Mycena olivaceomarginata]|nr:hypothetical protein B0H14DRAFT_3671873 [Mycena olivaceomarginata]
MEKFYIFGSIIISLCLTVPPYAAKQYGLVQLEPTHLPKTVGTRARTRRKRLAWQIGTQLFWTLLTVAGKVATASTVIIYIVQHQKVPSDWHWISNATTPTPAVVVKDRLVDDTVYRSVIFRIVINLTSVACVIHITQEDGVHNWTGYSVLLVSDFLYGVRAALYALLAATDPGLVRAVRAFIQSKKKDLSVQGELSTIQQNDSRRKYGPYYDELKMGPRPDIEEGPRDHDDLQDLESTGVDAPGNGCHIWLQEDMIRRRKEMLTRDRDRQEFQKQI